jgi:hypothetical protein
MYMFSRAPLSTEPYGPDLFVGLAGTEEREYRDLPGSGVAVVLGRIGLQSGIDTPEAIQVNVGAIGGYARVYGIEAFYLLPNPHDQGDYHTAIEHGDGGIERGGSSRVHAFTYQYKPGARSAAMYYNPISMSQRVTERAVSGRTSSLDRTVWVKELDFSLKHYLRGISLRGTANPTKTKNAEIELRLSATTFVRDRLQVQ